MSRRNKRKFAVLPAVGVLIVLAFVSAIVYGEIISFRKAESVPEILETLERLIPEGGEGVASAYQEGTMPSLSVDGKDYCGILQYEDKEAYPVFRSGDCSFSADAPYRESGNPTDGGFVIGGYCTEDWFSFVTSCEAADTLTFTDVFGQKYTYTVRRVSHDGRVGKEILPQQDDDLIIYGRPCGKLEYVVLHCSLCY